MARFPSHNVNEILQENFPAEFLEHLGHEFEVINYTRGAGGGRRGRPGGPVRNDAESATVVGRIRVPNAPLVRNSEGGQTVEYDAIVTLPVGAVPIYASDDPEATYPSEIVATSPADGSAGRVRYRVLNVRDRFNSLLDVRVREVNHSLVDERSDEPEPEGGGGGEGS